MSDRLTASTITDAQLDELYARLALAEQEADTSVAAAAHLATLVGKRSEKAEKAAKAQRRRAEIAETELRVLRTGLRANGADPTQIQNLWAQIRMRNQQWREEKQRAAQAEELLRIAHETSNTSEAERARAAAAVARVTALYEQWVKAGAPPLGVSMSRWWDARLVELHHAILPPANQPKEK